jgi:intracellular septation protein A
MKTMSNSPMAQKSQDLKPNIRQAFGGMLPSILINAVVPVVIYLLASPHMPTMAALALTAIPPVLYSGYGWVRARSIDLLSIISLFLIVVSMLLALLVHDPHLLLLKDSYETGAFGLLCLLSLPFPRPVGYYVYRWAFVRTPEQLVRLNAGWQVPYARFVRRLITAV